MFLTLSGVGQKASFPAQSLMYSPEYGKTKWKQAERLKSRERRPEVDRLDSRWSIGSYQISYAVK